MSVSVSVCCFFALLYAGPPVVDLDFVYLESIAYFGLYDHVWVGPYESHLELLCGVIFGC